MKILLIEDYGPVRKYVSRGLREAGYAVDTAADGEEGLWYAETGEYDAVVLDLMLPKKDGRAVLDRLREKGNPVPVLILSARDALEDRVDGLNRGADDYLVKPFAMEELLARVDALVRRKYKSVSRIVRVDDLVIDRNERTVTRAGRPIELTAREYAILEFLALRAGKPVSRTELWEHLYDFSAEPGSNVIDVHVSALRKKIEAGGLSRLIHTRRGLGYMLGEADRCAP